MLSTPFCYHIIHYDPPRGFLMPKFSTYDGWVQRSLRPYHALSTTHDSRYRKRRAALSWFHCLPSNSVDNFRDLSEAFVGQYLCSARQKQNISTLQNIKMQENESLREFVKRFGTPFFESLAKKPPTTMNNLFWSANKYSMLEDDVQAATQQILVVEQASRSGAKRSAKIPDRPRPSGRRQEEQSCPKQPPLTPLSISYEKLLPMIQDMSDFRWPGPLRTDPSKRDHSKKCAYHKEHGHTTEMCRSIYYLVEKLIRAGHLKQYLYSDTRAHQLHTAWDNWGGPRPIDGTIIFPPVDPTRILQLHRDAFILSLEIGDFDVRRILVDLGSSTDLVQASVISHMGRNLTSLENPGRILSGFNGASTTSLGDIVLPIQADPVTLNVQFSVIQDLSPFNVILGHTWLHYMKVIPSTYHQMVSFLTKDEQIDLYDSQLAAR
uniref:Retrotransposon gag domain-containing protein n=1 Tax=Vitis vinifera TaxID=29760 RepID=A5BF73_VITVI|nr:hypothetical protein VITISV_027058 [Vitis vinifera]